MSESKYDKDFYKFLDQMLKRKKGELYEYLAKEGFTPAEFSENSGLDFSNLAKMNQCVYKGSVTYWVKIWRALRRKH